MMAKRTNTQLQQAHNLVPKSIRFGRVLLVIASVLFFIDAALSIVQLAFSIETWIDNNFLAGEFFVDPTNIIDMAALFILTISALFMVFAGIGGINYVRDKGPFISWVSLAAILSGVLFVVRVLLQISYAFQSSLYYDLSSYTGLIEFSNEFQIDTIIYFFGWMLAKNWLD